MILVKIGTFVNLSIFFFSNPHVQGYVVLSAMHETFKFIKIIHFNIFFNNGLEQNIKPISLKFVKYF